MNESDGPRVDGRSRESAGYHYYRDLAGPVRRIPQSAESSRRLSGQRLNPSLRNPDYLLLRSRRRFFARWVREIPGVALNVLDVGGRIQPYRGLLGARVHRYIGLDPQIDGLTDVVAEGEKLPFRDRIFDVVICTQVLTYVVDPWRVVDEMYRVLIPGGVLLLTVPAFSPRHHDERWRFLPDGLQLLLQRWDVVEIRAEGRSWVGVMRTAADCAARSRIRVARRLLVPVLNCLGLIAYDGLGEPAGALSANIDVFARRPPPVLTLGGGDQGNEAVAL